MPERLQRSRRKGYRLPDNAVSVTRPGRFGNPFKAGIDCVTAEQAVELFRLYAEARVHADPEWLEPLRGKDLACFCPLEKPDGSKVPCHADVLLSLLAARR